MNSKTSQALRYGEIAGYLLGAFCLVLALLELCGGFKLGSLQIPPRWDPAHVTFPVALSCENGFFIFYGLLLLLPWQKTPSTQIWKWGFIVLCVASVLFAFAMISEVMAKNYLAQSAGTKARLPVFQANLLFLSLGQIPLALFRRKPELLS